MPVRKRLLLVLLDREVHEYLCARCGSSLAKKNEPLQAMPLSRSKRSPGNVF